MVRSPVKSIVEEHCVIDVTLFPYLLHYWFVSVLFYEERVRKSSFILITGPVFIIAMVITVIIYLYMILGVCMYPIYLKCLI